MRHEERVSSTEITNSWHFILVETMTGYSSGLCYLPQVTVHIPNSTSLTTVLFWTKHKVKKHYLTIWTLLKVNNILLGRCRVQVIVIWAIEDFFFNVLLKPGKQSCSSHKHSYHHSKSRKDYPLEEHSTS